MWSCGVILFALLVVGATQGSIEPYLHPHLQGHLLKSECLCVCVHGVHIYLCVLGGEIS